jgi:hypothetical protein
MIWKRPGRVAEGVRRGAKAARANAPSFTTSSAAARRAALARPEASRVRASFATASNSSSIRFLSSTRGPMPEIWRPAQTRALCSSCRRRSLRSRRPRRERGEQSGSISPIHSGSTLILRGPKAPRYVTLSSAGSGGSEICCVICSRASFNAAWQRAWWAPMDLRSTQALSPPTRTSSARFQAASGSPRPR